MGFNSSRDGASIVAILSNLHKVVDSTKNILTTLVFYDNLYIKINYNQKVS